MRAHSQKSDDRNVNQYIQKCYLLTHSYSYQENSIVSIEVDLGKSVITIKMLQIATLEKMEILKRFFLVSRDLSFGLYNIQRAERA